MRKSGSADRFRPKPVKQLSKDVWGLLGTCPDVERPQKFLLETSSCWHRGSKTRWVGLIWQIEAMIGSWQRNPKVEADFLCHALAQDVHQAYKETFRLEKVPNAMDNLRQRSSDRLLPGLPRSPLSFKHRLLNGLY